MKKTAARSRVPKPSADTLLLLVDSVRDYGIFVLDPTGVIKTWNTGAERLKGYKPNEIIGKNFEIFYTEEARKRKHPAHELVIAAKEGRYEEEGWRVRKDGSQFWANIVITHLVGPDGKTVGFGKVTRDLTERKRAEEALRESEAQARMVYESVKDYAILTLDTEGKILTWNEGARRIKGYESREIIGQHFSRFYTEEDIALGKWQYELREAAITGRFEDEGWRVRKDGTRFWANVVITALYDQEHQVKGFSKVTRDMTERKRGEDRLKMANEGLERRIQQRTEDLTRSNDALRKEVLERTRAESELQDAVRARDEFLSIASHELRTPITPIKLQLQLLLSHLHKGTLSGLPAERLERMAASIDRSLNRMGKLIDSLLDVARINAGKIELNVESLDVTEVTRETCSRFEQEAALAGSTVKVKSDFAGTAMLDRVRFEQVLSNLVTNAIKYGAGSPIEVLVHAPDEKTVCLEVRDTGIGIARDDLERIFKRFEQVTRQTVAGGLGLGLYITRQIVAAQGGKIRVESELGKGSTFTVELPLKRG